MDNLVKNNLIVTVFGGSGFIGSHVADHLSKNGHRVKIFDLKHSNWLREDQEMIVGDILEKNQVDEAIKGSDVVYNFAAIADLNNALDQPLETIKANVLGNIHILEACRKNKIKRFVYASTVYVYSREGGFYRCSKQASEQLVEEYNRTYNLDYTILRYGSIYGPRSDEQNGLYCIVRDAILKGVVSYRGHPEAMREYVHIDDVARASVIMLDQDYCNKSVVITGQEPMRVYDMLHILAEIIGIPKKVEFVEKHYRGHYTRTPYAYQEKIARKYVPPLHVDLGQGLLQLIEEVKEKINIK